MSSRYMTESEAEDARNGLWRHSKDVPPHCNLDVFHAPGVCPFCDGYYKDNPDFQPVEYATREVPIVDDEKAQAEDEAWKQALQYVASNPREGTPTLPEGGSWLLRLRKLLGLSG